MSSADLWRGCRDGEISTVALAICNGVDSKKPIEGDYLKRTPLHIACENNHLDLVKFLAEGKHCNLEAKNSDGQTPLHVAARQGNVEMVKYLIEVQRCSATTTDNNKRTPLHDACLNHKLDVIWFLVQGKHCKFEVKNKDGETVLHSAVRDNHLDLVKFLAEGKHCNLEAKNSDGLTPLHVAASLGNLDIVTFLVEGKHCDLEAKDKDGDTPLHYAMKNDKLDVVWFLVQGKHCKFEVNNKDGETLLHSAVRNNHLDLVKFLAEGKHCNFEVKSSYGQTSLHVAASSNNWNIVTFLVEGKHCDLEAKDKDGETLLHYAMRNDEIDVIWFLARGKHCNLDAKNKNTETLLHYAVRNNHLDLVKFLAEGKHCNFEVKSSYGQTSLHVAASSNNWDIVTFLVEGKHCDLEAKDKYGETLLHYAIREDKLDVIWFLVRGKHCNLDAKNRDGETLLHYAMRKDKLDVIWFLVHEKHCNLDAKNKNGETLLHYAVRYNHLDLVKFLAEGKHCNLEAKDSNGQTPLYVAASQGNVEIVKYLIEVQGCSATTTDNSKQTPLHSACLWGKLDVVKFLMEGKHCNPEAEDYLNRTPLYLAAQNDKLDIVWFLVQGKHCKFEVNKENLLHSAVSSGNLDIVTFLVEGKHCDLEAKNKYGETLLHYAIRNDKLDVVWFLVQGKHCKFELNNKYGENLLHSAVSSGNLDIVTFLVEGKHCDLEAKYEYEQTPLHYAMINNKLDVIWFLVRGNHCNLNARNKAGETLLHYAARNNHLDFVKFLAEGKHCNLEAKNSDGQTPLHIAASWNNWDIVTFLVEGKHCNLETKDKDGETQLHYAMKNNHLDLVKFLAEGKHCNLEAKNSNGQTPLHVAARNNHLDLVKFLAEGKHCNLEAKSSDGQTPLHFAARNNNLDVVRFLVQGKHCNLEAKNKEGETPLHYAVKYSYGNIKNVVECLLRDGQCDPNCSTRLGQTPLDMTNDAEKIRLLLNYGAKPTSCFPTRLRESPDAAVNMFVLGDPGAGKSTLVKAVSNEGNALAQLINRFYKVTDVDEKTAGIIPHEIRGESLGRVNLYDFAGHREYYAGHDALLQNSMRGSPSIVTLVVDFSEEEDKIKEKIQYWLQFISNHGSDSGPNPHLLVVGSHAEKLSAKESREKSSLLQLVISSHNLSGFSFIGNIMMDCRYSESTSMSKLRSKLSESCKLLRSSAEMAAAHHSYLVFLLDRFREEVAVTLGEASAEMTKHLNSRDYIYLECAKSSDSLEMCKELNNRGNILFMRNDECPQQSWIIFNKAALLSQVNGVIFAPDDFKEHQKLSSDSGIVPLSKLVSVFPKLHSDMITQFLCHLEFCQEVTDPEVLALLHDSSNPIERLLFFPGLVKLSIPSNVWQPNDQFGYHSGWLLKCSKPEQFFNPRFLQVLLLRVAYSLAFVSSAADAHVLPRNCQVWKCGMSWSNRSGFEVVVEIVNNKQVIVVMRCFESHTSSMELLRMRSAIIRMILNTKEELCSNVDVQESFLHPESVKCYPLTADLSNLVPIEDVIQAVVEGKSCALDENLQMLKLDTLLLYEPFANLGNTILRKIFDNIASQVITKEFTYQIAENLHKSHSESGDEKNVINRMSSVLQLTPLEVVSVRKVQDDIDQLARIIQLWRDKTGAEGTLVNLRKLLHSFSIFAGRNPLALIKSDTNPRVVQPPPDASLRQCHYSLRMPALHELDMLEGKGKRVRVIDRVAHRWEEFATRLHFEDHDIMRIQRDCHQTQQASRQVIMEWQSGKGRQPATWNTLIKALGEAKLSETAEELKYILED